MDLVSKKRIGVLRGGEGKDYLNSLRMGGEIISHLAEHLAEKYKVIDILVDQNGLWHAGGLPIVPADLIHKVDVVWNVAHPNLSLTLRQFSIPTIGVNAFASSIGDNRTLLEQHIKNNLGINMPKHIIFPFYQEDFDGSKEKYVVEKSREVLEKFAGPWIVRFLPEDHRLGIHIAKTFLELEYTIKEGMNNKKSILVEELISGKVVSMHSIRGFRGENIYTFPLENNFTITEKEKLNIIAKNLHNHFGEHPYLKSNFVVTPMGKVYLTGILFHPNLKSDSHLSKACESVGAKMHHMVEHIIEQVL